VKPQIFADFQLAQRLERAEGLSGAQFVDARAQVRPSSGAARIEVADTLVLFDGPESPVTQTFGLGMSGSPVTVSDFEKIEAFYQERSAPVFHEVSPLAGVSVFEMLNERGYKPTELTSVLYQELDPSMRFTPQDGAVRVRKIGLDEGSTYANVSVRGWAETSEFEEFVRGFTEILLHKADAILFLAEISDQPVACATLVVNGTVALMAGACTLPEARRQGAQLALLHTRLEFAAQLGCELAMMGALPGSASQRNAERHGFRIAYTRTKWKKAFDRNGD